MPSGLSLPFTFGMYTRRAGSGLYDPASSSSRILASSCWRFASNVRLSTPSTPGVRAPLDTSVMRAASLSQSLSAISLRSRLNLRSLFSVDHVASLLCISLIIKGLHLTTTASLRRVAGSPDLGLLRRLCQPARHRGHTPLASVQTFPSSHVGLNAWARLPVAVFILACRKSSRTPRSSCALPVVPCRPAYLSSQPSCCRAIRVTGNSARSAHKAVWAEVTLQPSDAV
ncbi:hypothetical protein SAMN04487768_0185 [Burkholderia sp. b13]|nr:hypothetical protein SAMN04487768_0185 [Burkholderia sp. b13]